MRRLLLIALLVAQPAYAGMKATYEGASEPRTIQIEVADNGDFRVGKPGDPNYGVQLANVYYVVSAAKDGTPRVAAINDLAAVIGEKMPPAFRAIYGDGAKPERPALQITPGEERTVAGHKGQVQNVKLQGPNPEPQQFVFSKDPQLAPLGKAIGQYLEASMVLAAPMIGEMATQFVGEMRQVFALGTPLESTGRFKLIQAGASDVAGERLKLPVKPLTRDQIRSEIETLMPAT